ncbi:hypothetical protein P691DRAFT_783308 [Macrolepiota fuliginosa MF-IS2]|uniref:Uncharacterized protein n=1 Tax=Macrolepiota fuliginosa MF-IS2 TaxID=1400762 RepID=A0A9P5XN49_9AGAR|nr:hypothetical protein P691DRAFT_783308 [Macrolepiota fuliginosa MF-IS2]
MPMTFWKPKPRGKERSENSSASESGDSPTSTTKQSQQSQIPVPADGSHPAQTSSSRRNEPGHSSSPGLGTSIGQNAERYNGIDRPVQPMAALDYQPPGYRGLPPPSSSSKRIYNMPVSNAQTNYDALYTRNALDTFKFGSPSITTVTDASSQVDPLSSEEEFPHHAADTTPRPSLAVHPEGIRSHPSQVTSSSDRSSLVSHRPVRSDASSTHTFGTRSHASGSAPSLSGLNHGDRPQAGPGASQEPVSDDEPHIIHHHPPYINSIYSSSSADTFSTREEFYYFDEDDVSDPEIYVSSARSDDAGSYDQSYWDPPPDQDSFIADYLSNRRGSNPIPIPGAQEGQFQGRDREDSVATVRYPTPSAPGPSPIAPMSPTAIAPNPLSLPANYSDWDQRRRAIQERIDPPATARLHPPVHAIDYGAIPLPSLAGPSTSHGGNDHGVMDFDMKEWGNISVGIKGQADLGNVDAATTGNGYRLWPLIGDARRPSVAETINDTFQKHALAFKDQDWSFRKDKADGSTPVKKRNTFIPFHERPVKGGPPWRGMAVGQTEYWRNELTGMYKVERLEIVASENRPPQQRLSVHHQRDGSRQTQRPIPGLPFDPHNGPTTTIHKHSKAAAFSLSRHYRDKSQSSKSADRRANSSKVQPLRNAVYINGKKTAMILLAPRKVQEAYTSTTTTRKLESHGLLDDAHRSRDLERWRRLAEEDEKLKEKQKMKEKVKREKEMEKQRKAAEEKAKKDKGKGRARGQESMPETSSITQIETTSSTMGTSQARPQTAPGPPSAPSTQAAPGDDPTPVNGRSRYIRPTNITAPPLQHPTISSSSSITVPVVEMDAPTSSNHVLPLSTVMPSSDAQSGSSRLEAPQLEHSVSTASEHTMVNPVELYPSSRYRGEEGEEEIDEEDEQLGLAPRRRKRTPHNEAYNSLSPESIDSFAAQQDNHSRGFLSLLSGRNASSRTLHVDSPYNPPWLSAPSRPNNHEMQMQVVAGLNTSFQGVGLLPTDKEIREGKRRKALKNQSRDGAKTERKYTKEKDIFVDLPDDALYMLLPLWPSETDPVSTRDHPFEAPIIPISERLYALVYYKPYYPPEYSGKSKNRDKPRKSRSSPTNSQDGIYIDERNVLMSQFYIGARLVTYKDLEGSNVRVPELGLSVMGPPQEAFDAIPFNTQLFESKDKGDRKGKGRDKAEGKEKNFWDYIIGSYQSRDHPVEFYPDGFKKMGLATQTEDEDEDNNAVGPSGTNGTGSGSGSQEGSIRGVASNNASTSSLPSVLSNRSSRADIDEIAPFGEPDPSNAPAPSIQYPLNSEERPIEEPPIILTPLGRAVLEMAFMGALAVTGFAPQPFW